jgi:ABC-2 type transport system ATP-binding protein
MKVKDLLSYSASFYKKDCSAKIKELAKRLDLDLNRKIDDLSYGNKKKVGIVQGLLHSPKVIILDEPTGGLDPLMQQTFFEILKEENKRGATVLFSSHILSEVQKICDRVAIINRGRIAAIDSPERLKGTIQSVQSVEVAFNGPAPGREDDLRHLAGVSEVRKEGDKFRLFTQEPSHVIAAVMEYAQVHNSRVISMTTFGPSLEDVFIRLTGLEVRAKGVSTVD